MRHKSCQKMSENKITRKKCAQDGKNLIKSRYIWLVKQNNDEKRSKWTHKFKKEKTLERRNIKNCECHIGNESTAKSTKKNNIKERRNELGADDDDGKTFDEKKNPTADESTISIKMI